jgi:hypothetical protein
MSSCFFFGCSGHCGSQITHRLGPCRAGRRTRCRTQTGSRRSAGQSARCSCRCRHRLPRWNFRPCCIAIISRRGQFGHCFLLHERLAAEAWHHRHDLKADRCHSRNGRAASKGVLGCSAMPQCRPGGTDAFQCLRHGAVVIRLDVDRDVVRAPALMNLSR